MELNSKDLKLLKRCQMKLIKIISFVESHTNQDLRFDTEPRSSLTDLLDNSGDGNRTHTERILSPLPLPIGIHRLATMLQINRDDGGDPLLLLPEQQSLQAREWVEQNQVVQSY